MRNKLNHTFSFAAICSSFLTVGVSTAEADSNLPNIGSEIFSPDRIEKYGFKRYSIDSSGWILDGYRVSRNEPVDYSPLLNDATLARDFTKSVLGCDSCSFEPFYWPEAKLTYHFVATTEAQTPYFFFKAGEELYDVFAEGGIEAKPVTQAETANLIIFVGDADFLLRKARQVGDQDAIALYSSRRFDKLPTEGGKGFLRKLFSATMCTVSLETREAEGKAYVFTPPDDLERCLSKQLLLVSGLFPFEGDVPSALNLNLEFTEATLADIIFLRAYYYIRKSLNVADEDLQSASEWVFSAADFEKRMR